jgi:hypothetical protein
MLSLVETYLKSPMGQELEARYKGITPMKRYDYIQIVRSLAALGFKAEEGVNQVLLRIYVNQCRVELSGFMAVQAYCTNEELPKAAVFVKKSKPVGMSENDYGMRLALAKETPLEDDEIQTLRRQWATLPKRYRYLNRKRLSSDHFKNWAVDCTITKSSYANVYRFADSDLFAAPELCEVETEAIVSAGVTAVDMMDQLKKISTAILGGMQGTPYPVTHKKMGTALLEYQTMVRANAALPLHQQFVAPNPVALQLENITAPMSVAPTEWDESFHEDACVSILKGYAVTDKADGVRKMLFVSSMGELFFLNARMAVENVNCSCLSLKGTLLDGEFIDGTMYAVFDVYFFKGQDCRGLKLNARLEKMREAVDVLKPLCKYKVVAKTFYQDANIFDACSQCLSAKLPYTTDGLIFTPVDKAVGVALDGQLPPDRAYTWDLNLKWKPPEQTTIDFLVRVQETCTDKNLVVLNVLCRGSKNWALPQTALLEQVTNVPSSKEGLRPFMTEEDPASHLCYLNVVNGEMVANGMVVKAGDVVEFRYYPERDDLWKWDAVKVRVDKDTPNTFTTAYNNWNAIQHPIPEDAVRGYTVLQPHRYYVGNKKAMQQLRGFHRYVKGQVLEKVVGLLHKEESTPSLRLFDLGVGQAGDLGRWRSMKLSFVFGLDVNRDNIVNRQDGACMRYLTTTKGPMRAIFAVGDASKPAFAPATELDELIVGGIFGKVPVESVAKYPNLATYYNTSFQIVSCMFCIHYMFETKPKLEQFLDNVAAATALGGYFVGTAWDGKELFGLLRQTGVNESVVLDDFTITKRYTNLDFEGDPVAVGYAVDVSQKTYNPATEYLVDFEGLTTLLLKRGFKIVDVQSFRTYYTEDVLTTNEKKVSFMNNTFVYQKIGVF